VEETGFRTDTLCVDDVVKATSELQNESMLSEVVLTQHLIRISDESFQGHHQLQSLIRQLGRCLEVAVCEDDVVGTVSEAPTVDGGSPLLDLGDRELKEGDLC